MRHRKSRHQFNRYTTWRQSTIVSLVRNLLIHERINTTLVRAKATQQVVDSLIHKAKSDTLAAKREAFALLGDHKLVSLLFSDIAPRFKKRVSGFTRILKTGTRRGDNATMVLFELTELKEKPKKAKARKEEAKSAPAQGSEHPAAEKEKPAVEHKPKTETAVAEKERPQAPKKPARKFLGGIRSIFKKERDSL
jgi:large subunit ribosomal protein L17